MAFKYTCILLLVSLAFLLAQAKHVKKDKKGDTKQKGKSLWNFYTENIYIMKYARCNWDLLLFEALTSGFNFQDRVITIYLKTISSRKSTLKEKLPTIATEIL